MDGKAEQYFAEKLKKGCGVFGLESGLTVVFSQGADIVCDTAYKKLSEMLKKAEISFSVTSLYIGGRAVILGTAASEPCIRQACRDGILSIGNVSPEDDGFEIKTDGDITYIAGANGRGALYGVYDFEEYLSGGAPGLPDRKVVPAIRKRSDALGYYWNRYQGMIQDDIFEEKVEYLSRLRVNQYHACQDGNYPPHFHNLVKSEKFPYMRDPDPEYVRKTKKLSRLMKEYGIDYYQWIIEPVLPALGSDNVKDFPSELLGRKTPPDWYTVRPEGIEYTMCVNSPAVREYYFDISGRFAAEYPDIKGIFMYNNDCQAWFCEPSECEKCRLTALEPTDGRPVLWENEMRIQSIVNEGLHSVRPDMGSLFWPTVHFSPDEVSKLLENTDGYTAICSGWDGQDHDAMVPDCCGEPCEAVKLCMEKAAETDIPMYIYFGFNRSESLPQGFPYPHMSGRAIKKFYSWGIRNLVEATGPSPNCNSVNALVMKALETDPSLDIDEILDDICEKQFGGEAGKIMHTAFTEIKKGMEVWDNCKVHPFRGSSNHFGMGPIMHYPPSLCPEEPDPFVPYLREAAYNLPSLYYDAETAEKVSFAELLCRNAEHFEKAAELALKAADTAKSDEYIFFAYYDEGPEGLGIPTKKQYAEMNASIIRIAALFCREKTHKLQAARLIFDAETADEAGKTRINAEYAALVARDIPLQEKMLEMLYDFKRMSPQLIRVGITEKQIDDMLELQKKKLSELNQYQKSTMQIRG